MYSVNTHTVSAASAEARATINDYMRFGVGVDGLRALRYGETERRADNRIEAVVDGYSWIFFYGFFLFYVLFCFVSPD